MTFPGRSAPSSARWCCRRSAATPPSSVAAILSVLGVYVLFRFLGRPCGPGPGPAARCPRACSPSAWAPASWTRSGAAAGARWGHPTLLASGRMEPRKVIGSVDTGEFLVALGASLGFLILWSWRQVPVTLCLLLAGGLVAALAGRLAGQAHGPRKPG